MSKKVKQDVMAVIDIGSNELRLKIAENNKGKMKLLESLRYPLNLGRDTFNTGEISFEKIDKACAIIKNYLTVVKEYEAKLCKIVATTAVRESLNQDYVLDQIKIKTGVTVNVIDDSEEKFYIYKLMSYLIDNSLKESAMMVYTGSGNVGLSVWNDGKIPFAQNIKVGSLRISEIFENIMEYSNQFYLVVEEFLESFTDILDNDIPENIKNFIASGQEIAIIANLCNAETDKIFLYIYTEKFYKLYEEIKYKSVERISEDYGLALEKSEILLPAMCIYKNLLEFTGVEKIITPLVFLSDALMFEMLYPEKFLLTSKEFDKSTIISARAIAKKFRVMEKHVETVEICSLKIFDKMRKIHGMGKKEKLLLQTAAILHDVGKYVNVKNHYNHSYNIIKGVDIIGLSFLDMEIVANISLYHSRIVPHVEHPNYIKLNRANRVLVSKLAAILRIADALDRSHQHKFSDIDVKLTESELIVTISTSKNTDLEQWSFNEKGLFFEEVFGIKAIIKSKRVV